MILQADIRPAQSSSLPALLLLHGFMGLGRDWDAIRDELAPDITTIAFDLPGHGNSVAKTAGIDSVRAAADLVHRSLRAVYEGPYVLAGYSMGGRIALNMPLDGDDAPRGLVAVGASPGIEHEDERLRRRSWDDQQAANIEDDFARFLDRWYDLPLFAPLRIHAGFKAMFARRAAMDRAGLAWAMRTLGTGNMPPVWEKIEHESGALSVPTLFVAGELDSKYSQLLVQTAQRCPAVRTQTIARSGHAVHLEQPQLLAAALRGFCLTLAQRTGEDE